MSGADALPQSYPLMFSLSGRRVLVTGAGRGIGRAVAVGMAQAGATVALAARSGSELEDTATLIGDLTGERRASWHAVDLSRVAALPGLVDTVQSRTGGVLDTVVHAAGAQTRGLAFDISDADWDRLLAVNLTAPWRLSVEVARAQQAAGTGGSHVFIASVLALTSRPGVSPYIASKSGVLGVIRALSTEWAPSGIRVNGVGPGYIETALTEPLFADPAWREATMGRLPLGRFGTVQDIVGPVIFLASQASAYVTGQLLTVDGGWTTS